MVLIRGAVYPLQETLVFSSQDSGSANASISYAAYPGKKDQFKSPKGKLKNWSNLDDVENSYKILASTKGLDHRARPRK